MIPGANPGPGEDSDMAVVITEERLEETGIHPPEAIALSECRGVGAPGTA
jgi:hypothetical protein